MLKKEDLSKINSTILFTGETGTGKSSLARWIAHQKNVELTEVNLASLQDNLIESEIFGHKRGAFTGAFEDKIGYVGRAKNGILFLDEIGELPLSLQKKFLFLLEEKTYVPVGSTKKISFEGQIILATHKNLKEMVEKQLFREDLYYRLMVFPFKLESLKNLPELILPKAYELLAYHFNQKYIRISEEVQEIFLHYSWPGNIRELKNCLEYALIFADEIIEIEHLPSWILNFEKIVNFDSKLPDYLAAFEQFERSYFLKAMEQYQGKINHTAIELKISKATLIQKLKKYQINSLNYRAKKREIELAS
jgi:Nif-specific regulatory protein